MCLYQTVVIFECSVMIRKCSVVIIECIVAILLVYPELLSEVQVTRECFCPGPLLLLALVIKYRDPGQKHSL